MGKPEYNKDKKEDVVQEEKRGTNDFRAEIGQQTKVSENILKSLQKCCLKAIFQRAEFSARSDISFCVKTNWRRVGAKRQKKISFRAENSA